MGWYNLLLLFMVNWRFFFFIWFIEFKYCNVLFWYYLLKVFKEIILIIWELFFKLSKYFCGNIIIICIYKWEFVKV